MNNNNDSNDEQFIYIFIKEKKRQCKGKPLSDQYKLFIEKLRGLISLAVRDRYRRECQ